MENAGKDDKVNCPKGARDGGLGHIPDEAERKGLGTPATRAAIIEKLVAAGFVERKGKSLIPTKAGINLVTVLPEPLTSPMLTAEWEQKLTEIARGSTDPDTFMDGIRTMVQEIVSTYSCISEDGKKLFAPEKEVIGTCPRCGQSVYEGKKNFACSDRSCGFVLWKNDRFWTSRKKELTKKMAADLPEEEKSEWAMDIAFDMDEFFRQNDPQYAAEHPEAHAAKEELYENLMAGRISALDEKLAALGQTQEDYLPSEIEKFKDATGYEEFLDFDPAEVKAALDDPAKSRVDEMLAAAEKVASEKMTVLVVEPMKEPYVKEIDPGLHSLQAEVGGDIGATYPYSDPVALVCNDEGKLIGLNLNRGLRDENGEIYDIVAGTFLVVGLGEEDFASLSPELIQKYTEQFKTPERFMQINGNIVVLPVLAEKQDLAYLPDRFETGERVQTPRGSFQVTAMSREQMEAAGYGVHHISDDGKYLIMGNGTRAFAVAAEQPEKDNPLRTAEMTLEDDYGMIDGVINNGRRGEELEKAQEYAERTTPEKPSIRERLEDAKRECAEHKPPEGKKSGRDVPEQDCL